MNRLNDASKREISKILNIDYFFDDKTKTLFFDVLEKYMEKKRKTIGVLLKDLDTTINFFNLINYDKERVAYIILRNPSILHSNKNDLYLKYLILDILGYDNDVSLRDKIFISKPKDYLIGVNLLYARMCFLSKLSSEKNINLLDETNLLKLTNEDFFIRYGITKEELISNYPLTESGISYIYSLPGNSIFNKKPYMGQRNA